MRQVDFNVSIFRHVRNYHKAALERGVSGVGSIGLYFRHDNAALVRYISKEQAMRTAIHEAVHTMNFTMFGYVPSWINEGMAEYFEFILIENQHVVLSPHTDWAPNGKIIEEILELYSLLETVEYWPSYDAKTLYSSSWAWITLLMHSQEGRDTLFTLLKMEQSNPCTMMNETEIYMILMELFPTIEQAMFEFKTQILTPQVLKLP